MKRAKKKVKEIKPIMKFNPGTMSYEPVLPVILTKDLNKRKKWTRKKSWKLEK